MAYGPVVISCFFGIFVRIRATDQIQLIIPITKKPTEMPDNNPEVLFTLKNPGNLIFSKIPVIKNGKVKSAIFLPLPTSAFNFMMSYFDKCNIFHPRRWLTTNPLNHL